MSLIYAQAHVSVKMHDIFHVCCIVESSVHDTTRIRQRSTSSTFDSRATPLFVPTNPPVTTMYGSASLRQYFARSHALLLALAPAVLSLSTSPTRHQSDIVRRFRRTPLACRPRTECALLSPVSSPFLLGVKPTRSTELFPLIQQTLILLSLSIAVGDVVCSLQPRQRWPPDFFRSVLQLRKVFARMFMLLGRNILRCISDISPQMTA